MWFFPTSQRNRLMRDLWHGKFGAQWLAEELYAMLGSDIASDQPINLDIPGDQPLLQGNQPPDDPAAGDAPKPVQIFKKGGDTKGGIFRDPLTNNYYFGDKNGKPTQSPAGSGSGSQGRLNQLQVQWLGLIKSGTGQNYVCNLYPQGKGGDPIMDDSAHPPAPKSFNVRCVEIDFSQTIPSGRWFVVFWVGSIVIGSNGYELGTGEYYLQAPIFEYTT